MAGQVRTFWREYRCKACGRLQFKGYLPYGARVQVKCWHGQCRRVNVYKITEIGVEYSEEIENALHTSGRTGVSGNSEAVSYKDNDNRNDIQLGDTKHRRRKVGAVAAG